MKLLTYEAKLVINWLRSAKTFMAHRLGVSDTIPARALRT